LPLPFMKAEDVFEGNDYVVVCMGIGIEAISLL
jgi:hypothetical protein